jgi:hypothetical protein
MFVKLTGERRRGKVEKNIDKNEDRRKSTKTIQAAKLDEEKQRYET